MDIEDDKNSKFFIEILKCENENDEKFKNYFVKLQKNVRSEQSENKGEKNNCQKSKNFLRYFCGEFGKFVNFDKLIDFFGWQKILTFITKYSREFEIAINSSSILWKFINISDSSDNCCVEEDYIKSYTRLLMSDEKLYASLNIEHILYHNNFRSIDLFLFFVHQLELTKLTLTKFMSRGIAFEQTNLEVVKWLIEKGVDIKYFIYLDDGAVDVDDDNLDDYLNDFCWTNATRKYFDGQDLETLIFLINYNNNNAEISNIENISETDVMNQYFVQMLTAQKKFKSQQKLLLFRLLAQNVGLDKVFSKSDLGSREFLEEKKSELQFFTTELNKYFPLVISQIILSAF
jgi:hypothetical protein